MCTMLIVPINNITKTRGSRRIRKREKKMEYIFHSSCMCMCVDECHHHEQNILRSISSTRFGCTSISIDRFLPLEYTHTHIYIYIYIPKNKSNSFLHKQRQRQQANISRLAICQEKRLDKS
jgi:hypothetical protein